MSWLSRHGIGPSDLPSYREDPVIAEIHEDILKTVRRVPELARPDPNREESFYDELERILKRATM